MAKRFMQRQRISSNETFFVQSHERILLESWRHWCILFFRIASNGCWWNIFQWRFVRESVYTWHNQMVLLWKEKNIRIPSDEIRIVVSKVLWEQRKFWVLIKGQDDKLQICKVWRWEIIFLQSLKKVIMTSSFDKIISVKNHSL